MPVQNVPCWTWLTLSKVVSAFFYKKRGRMQPVLRNHQPAFSYSVSLTRLQFLWFYKDFSKVTLRMLLVTKKILKLFWTNFYTLSHFTHLKSTFASHELFAVSQDFYDSGTWILDSVYVHYLSTIELFVSSV